DSMADIFSRSIRGVSGRVEVDPPRMVEGGETITTFRIAYEGDASQLRTALRQVFKAPLGMPSRFQAGDEKTILVRVGDALEMPPWAVLTDAQPPADDPFVEQLRGTLERLGQPRIAVKALQRGSVAGIDLADLAGAVRAELGRARLDVIH